ncbi:sodium:dicarboxylate symporter/C4-dicarboxylate transporter [Acetobacter orientalis]|uniref:Sodium:dicarboxylate symporter/C4-dicarboxylate transporter n=2 Tax=Acetobacter orientalis TaxID=146474 RepID=A0A2Z5ZH34_9PROT|nr:sodium:dicarboxylate symporter/C4-dicarboxylate transporter [Acetobacter orientalis]GAN66130.1 sodium:dicarboxylate symporter/C4-dicarboxylate transporter [Acetobacter orientalis]GEL62599.1 C4-dicarboxylate transporter DctA [Acetobacter orientalis]
MNFAALFSRCFLRMPSLFSQVVIATVLGLVGGIFFPSFAEDVRWTTAIFLRLIVMAVGPLLFCIVVLGIVGAGSLKTVGRLAVRSLVYFEGMTTCVLLASVAAAYLCGLGRSISYVSTQQDAQLISSYGGSAATLHSGGFSGFILSCIPHTPFSAFAEGNVLQILFFAILSGCCLNQMGQAGAPLVALVESISTLFSRIMRCVISLAPLGVFGAMMLTTAHYGMDTIFHLAGFVLFYFLFIAAFIVFVLGGFLLACGVNPIQFARYFREEIFIVLTTTTSDAVLPSIMEKLEKMGVERQVVGLVVPAGYSFNLDALSVYLGVAVIFLANATGTHLAFWQLATMLVTALIASKGAHGVPGMAIVVLAATLASVPSIPSASLVMLVAVDWFIGIARAIGNFAGNCVAPIVIGAWEKKLNHAQIRLTLSAHS